MQNSPARSGIDVGSVIADTYTLEALIGRGGMGAVFSATHKRLPGKRVAIKMLHAEVADEEVLARFKREAEIASRLGHPNIVQVHDFNVLPDGTPYLVLELLEGQTLAQRLREGPVPLEQTMTIVRQIGSALAAAHREGIVHRDLKPQNIFLVPTEVQGRVVEIAKVLDFGISKIRGSQTVQTQDSTLLGTPQYMAPEQALGQHAKVDERTDVFALGAIAYEMLGGYPAFIGASIPEVVFKVVYEQPIPLEQAAPGLAVNVKAAIERAMAKASTERFSSVGDFVEALTGQPLSIIRVGGSPAAAEGPGSGKRGRSNEAFARTVGSGDHGASPVSGIEATAASVKSIVRGSAPTIDSQNERTSLPVQQASDPLAPLVPASTRHRSSGPLIGSVCAAAMLAAIAMYFVMRSSPTKPSDAHADRVADLAASSGEPPLITADVTHGQPSTVPQVGPRSPASAGSLHRGPDPRGNVGSSAEPKIETAGSADPETATKLTRPTLGATTAKADPAAKNQRTDAGRTPHPPNDKDSVLTRGDTQVDEISAQKLKEAESLVEADPARAEQYANSVITGESAGPQQKLRAHAIRGAIMCTLHNDAEGAMNDVRAIRHTGSRLAPKFVKRIVTACHNAGFMHAEP